MIGGMGVLVLVLAILPLARGESIHIMRAESPGPSVDKLVPRMRTSASLLWNLYRYDYSDDYIASYRKNASV